jgi:hypothetical protein
VFEQRGEDRSAATPLVLGDRVAELAEANDPARERLVDGALELAHGDGAGDVPEGSGRRGDGEPLPHPHLVSFQARGAVRDDPAPHMVCRDQDFHWRIVGSWRPEVPR